MSAPAVPDPVSAPSRPGPDGSESSAAALGGLPARLARAFARSAEEARSLHSGMLGAACGSAASGAGQVSAALGVCRAYARKLRIERAVAEKLAAAELPVSARIDPAAGDEFGAALEDALIRLDPARAEALRLCALAGLTAREAAAVLGLPEEAVRLSLFQARRHLADLLTSNRGAPAGP